MTLPFTESAFLDTFGSYNEALWPVAAVLWVLAVLAVVTVARTPSVARTRFAGGVLALLWAWGGAAYHLAYFAPINPAALGFAALFLAEGALLAWWSVARRDIAFGTVRGWWRWAGLGLAAYALVYPALNLAIGAGYPRTPTFGVPCPTTILTVGLLLTGDGSRWRLASIIPVVWSAIGGSAALLLGVTADYVLLAAGIALAVNLVSGRPGTPRISETPRSRHEGPVI